MSGPKGSRSVGRRIARREGLVRTLIGFVPRATRSIAHAVGTRRSNLCRMVVTGDFRVLATERYRPPGAIRLNAGFRRDLLTGLGPMLIPPALGMPVTLPDLVGTLLDLLLKAVNH